MNEDRFPEPDRPVRSSPAGSGAGSNAGSIVIGIVLVLLGLFFLAGQIVGQFFNIDLTGIAWPFFIIIPAGALFLVSLFMEPNSGRGLAIFAGMAAVTGLILLVQNLTDLWSTWAYAWALITPTSIGLANMVYGALRGRGDWAMEGLKTAAVGLGIFLVAAFFFEVLIGLNNFPVRLGALAWPLLLILLGVILLFSNLFRRRA